MPTAFDELLTDEPPQVADGYDHLLTDTPPVDSVSQVDYAHMLSDEPPMKVKPQGIAGSFVAPIGRYLPTSVATALGGLGAGGLALASGNPAVLGTVGAGLGGMAGLGEFMTNPAAVRWLAA